MRTNVVGFKVAFDPIAIACPPRTSLGKFRRAVPEVWFRIIHVSTDHVKGSVELREQTVEVALGPEGRSRTSISAS
jgi:hypothetical protein